MNKIKHRQGNHYSIYNEPYLLTGFRIDGQDYACLFSIDTGNRFSEPVEVADFMNPTEKEFKEIAANSSYKLIEKK